MTAESQPPKHLLNQSVVRFSSGNLTSHAYSNTVDTPVVGPLITVMKKANTSEATLGQVVTYTLKVVNRGNLDAQVTLFDSMPDGTSLIPNSVIVDGIPHPLAKPDKGISLGKVHIGQCVEVTFQVVVLEPSSQLKNQAATAYTFHTPGGRAATGSSKSNTVIIPFEELKITLTKRADKAFTYLGDTVTFHFSIKNEGSYKVHKAQFFDKLPSGAVFVPGSVRIGQISYPSANPVDGIVLGELPPHTALSLQFQIKITEVPPSGRLVNHAELLLLIGDYKEKIRSNTVSLDVFDPVISAVLSVQQHKATIGDTLAYSVVISNDGNIAADLWLSDLIPEGASYVLGSLIIGGVPYGNTPLPGSLYVGLIQAKSQLTVTFRVTVNQSADQGQLTSQTAVLFTFKLPDDQTVSDSVLTNSVSTQLLKPVLAIVLTASPQIAEPGSLIHFQIRTSNTGNLAADNVSIQNWISPLTKLLPGTLRIGDASASLTEAESQPLLLGTIPANGWTDIVYTAVIISRPNTRRITLRSTGHYTYQVNDPVHTGSVLSNEAVIRIEMADE